MAKSRPLLSHLLQRLADAGSEEPIIFTPKDVRASQKSELQDYLNAGWIQKGIITHTACIACDAQADIIHPSPPLRALCGVCGTFFTVQQVDTLHYSTSFVQLAHWLCRLQDLDEPEKISEGIYFLGYHEHQGQRFEIILMSEQEGKKTHEQFQFIAQQKADPVIILSLKNKPTPSKIESIIVIHLGECLSHKQNRFHISFPKWAFMQVDSLKQRAGQARHYKDPRTIQIQNLENYLRKTVNSKYQSLFHHEIKSEIYQNTPEMFKYTSKDKEPTALSDELILKSIKKILRETGQATRISGIKYAEY